MPLNIKGEPDMLSYQLRLCAVAPLFVAWMQSGIFIICKAALDPLPKINSDCHLQFNTSFTISMNIKYDVNEISCLLAEQFFGSYL